MPKRLQMRRDMEDAFFASVFRLVFFVCTGVRPLPNEGSVGLTVLSGGKERGIGGRGGRGDSPPIVEGRKFSVLPFSFVSRVSSNLVCPFVQTWIGQHTKRNSPFYIRRGMQQQGSSSNSNNNNNIGAAATSTKGVEHNKANKNTGTIP